jgi:sulfonate transport system substrate-binding protein
MVNQLSRRQTALGLALAIPATLARAQPVQVVRIAATGYVVGGKLQVGGAGAAGRVAREGWLATELRNKGIGLEWYPVAGDTGPVINEAFASGRVQFASYGDLPSLILNAAGIRTKMVLPIGRGQDVYLMVPNGSSARSLKDLKGKRISLHRSRPWEMSFYKLIAQYGLSRSDFHIMNMDPHAGVAALASGNVDAHFSNNGLTYQARGVGKVIWSSQNDFDKKMRAELWALDSFINAHPDIAQLVVTAFLRAQYYNSQESHREEVIQEGSRNGTPIDIVRRTYSNPSITWKDYWTPLYDALVWDQYRQSAAFAYGEKIISRKVTAEELLEPHFMTVGLAGLQLEHYWQPWTSDRPPQ